jgi:hypothetical protein
MYARLVRFTGVTPDRIADVEKRVNENEGPPEGVPSTRFQVFVDEAQGTAVFVGYFETEEDMRKGSEVLEEMDPAETPGTRASVDMCELKLERQA